MEEASGAAESGMLDKFSKGELEIDLGSKFKRPPHPDGVETDGKRKSTESTGHFDRGQKGRGVRFRDAREGKARAKVRKGTKGGRGTAEGSVEAAGRQDLK